jgi:hypothetical protein
MASTISAGTTAGTAVAITGDTSGNLALLTQNGANTITVPNGTGTMAVNGVSSNIVAGTAVASTSGTSIDFTGIPSWVKRITVMFSGVSTTGANGFLIQLGDSGGIETTSYASAGGYAGPGNAAGGATSTSGYITGILGAASIYTGNFSINLVGSNTWVCSHSIGDTVYGYMYSGGGTKTLSGTLDRVRITTSGGTDTFDAGSINILYE